MNEDNVIQLNTDTANKVWEDQVQSPTYFQTLPYQTCEPTNAYNKFESVRSATMVILNYLFDNCPNLWKLLYYTDSNALYKDDLTNGIKSNMICKDPSIDGSTADKNVLFQIDNDDEMAIAINQLRIEVGDIIPLDSYRGACEVNFQIVVPNKQKLISSNYSQVDDRALAISQELIKSLNGTYLDCFSSAMFLNKRGDNGAGTGLFRERQNKQYSGYWISFMALC